MSRPRSALDDDDAGGACNKAGVHDVGNAGVTGQKISDVETFLRDDEVLQLGMAAVIPARPVHVLRLYYTPLAIS